jgi:hypothetical protein
MRVFAAALELAVENINMEIDGNMRPNRATHDDEYKRYMGALKQSRRDYQFKLRQVERLMKP